VPWGAPSTVFFTWGLKLRLNPYLALFFYWLRERNHTPVEKKKISMYL
jgi:hypothetical protein